MLGQILFFQDKKPGAGEMTADKQASHIRNEFLDRHPVAEPIENDDFGTCFQDLGNRNDIPKELA